MANTTPIRAMCEAMAIDDGIPPTEWKVYRSNARAALRALRDFGQSHGQSDDPTQAKFGAIMAIYVEWALKQ